MARTKRKSTRSQRRRRRGRRLAGLVGLGSAAVLVGLYAAGRRRSGPSAAAAAPAPPAALPAPRRLAGPAGELRLLDAGAGGLPVVLVHGLGGRAESWRGQLPHLWRRRRAVALDLRGHGGSQPAADGDYSIPALAADVAAVADGLGLERFVLAAHSLGAAVAAELAAARPERVAGLFLADPNGDQTRLPPAEVEPGVAAVAADPAGALGLQFRHLLAPAAPGARDEVLASLAAAHPAALAGAFAAAAHHPTAAALGRYGGPMLAVISPINTLPVSLHNLVAALPAEPLPGTSHWLMLDRPAEVNRLLDTFLAAVEARQAAPC